MNTNALPARLGSLLRPFTIALVLCHASEIPGSAATAAAPPAPGITAPAANDEWFTFNPGADPFDPRSVLDLRKLNEMFAGEHGRIRAQNGGFVRSTDGVPVRFWGVNGPPGNLKTPAELRTAARALAKYGVNLVRAHGAVFNEAGEPDSRKVDRLRAVVAALKAEGIYTHFSIYFPLWLNPRPENAWLAGYDGKSHPFAALMFNADFQARYRKWWEALLLQPDAEGHRLVDDPAVFGLEVQNEDSFLFWTFNEKSLPRQQLEMIESQFGRWAASRYGSIESALRAWGGARLQRDDSSAGRLAFRPLWNISHERTRRDQDTVEFLVEAQTRFYRETIAFLRSLGFQGLITASNWTTADNAILGPLERLSYLPGDFIDRHGYFSVPVKGEASEWSLRNGQTFSHRSALRFDPEKSGGPKAFVHPAMEIEYNGLPSMISETTWNRPNRYRVEAPVFYAAYGALQGTDAVVHFAHDGSEWSPKPGYFMQPWTLMAPTQVGQFPAAALIYRLGLVQPGAVLADIRLAKSDLLALKGTPLPQDAAFDELRLKDVPLEAGTLRPGQRVDPLIHFAGQAKVRFDDGPSTNRVERTGDYIDRGRQSVVSTTGELALDYRLGVLELRAPMAQGAIGALGPRGPIQLPDIRIRSEADPIGIVVVSLDGLPLATSQRMLLQAMTEERPTGWKSEPAGEGLERIVNIGGAPWQVRNIRGTVEFTREDSGGLKVTALDHLGMPQRDAGSAKSIRLLPEVVYYLLQK